MDLRKNGKNEFVVLPYEEFEALQELLEDARDLIELEQAREAEAGEPTMSLDDVAKKFGVTLER
jgi:PHD/YefM family antitoxin component YafN of YafNO toxin-antitoxin module